jgi:hypothetical protein
MLLEAHGRMRVAVTALVALLVPLTGTAQDTLVVRGHVALRTAHGERPVRRTIVTLHAIGAQGREGPVDSVRTDADGRYGFRFAADSALTYLATARYGGIAHFAAPVRLGDASAGDGEGEITVFDTTSQPLALPTRGRHIVLSAPSATGARAVIDVYEIENPGVLTRIVRDSADAVFIARLPAGALDVRTTQGDVPATGVRVQPDQVAVIAPVPPGVRQLVLTYDLPLSAVPLAVAVGPTDVLEVLAEEEGATAAGAGLEPQGPVSIEGRTFQRFLRQNVASAAQVTITPPVVAPGGGRLSPFGVALAIAGAAALGIVFAAASRPGRAPRPRRLVLAEALATVDRQLAAPAFAAQHAALREYRAALVEERDRLLADAGAAP